MAKDHALGPNAPTELIACDKCYMWKCGPRFDWVRVDGLERPAVCDDAHQTALSGPWLLIRDTAGRCFTLDTTNMDRAFAFTDLAGVNAYLARVGASPVSDADFRTFEELADARGRRRVKWSLVGLAITLGPLVGLVLVVIVRRRR